MSSAGIGESRAEHCCTVEQPAATLEPADPPKEGRVCVTGWPLRPACRRTKPTRCPRHQPLTGRLSLLTGFVLPVRLSDQVLRDD